MRLPLLRSEQPEAAELKEHAEPIAEAPVGMTQTCASSARVRDTWRTTSRSGCASGGVTKRSNTGSASAEKKDEPMASACQVPG